jgi:hypothetical protein
MPPPAGRAAAPPLAARTPTPLPRRVAARTAVADRSPPSGPPPAAAPAAAPPPRAGPLVLDSAVLHSATPRQLEVIAALTPRFGAEALPLLGAPAEMWQPADFLPDTDGSRGEAFFDDVRELRARAAGLPDALLAVLVGDMVTEEALPTYMAQVRVRRYYYFNLCSLFTTLAFRVCLSEQRSACRPNPPPPNTARPPTHPQLNTLDGVRDETGCDPTPWGRWTRAWVAEENRHGDALHKYLWLTGRVDGRAVERTVQRLVGAGMDPGFENNPYLGLVYTSFQVGGCGGGGGGGWVAVGRSAQNYSSVSPIFKYYYSTLAPHRLTRHPQPLLPSLHPAGARDEDLARRDRAPRGGRRRRRARAPRGRGRRGRGAPRGGLHARDGRRLRGRPRRRGAGVRHDDAQARGHARAPDGRRRPRVCVR